MGKFKQTSNAISAGWGTGSSPRLYRLFRYGCGSKGKVLELFWFAELKSKPVWFEIGYLLPVGRNTVFM